MKDSLQLPETGLLKISTVLKFIEVSPSTWWAGVRSGRYPKRVKDGGNTRWRAEDIREYLKTREPIE